MDTNEHESAQQGQTDYQKRLKRPNGHSNITPMRGSPKNNGDSSARVARQETFSDGSELTELENGAYVLRETSQARPQPFIEQPAPYSQPPPKPKLKEKL